MKKLLEPLKNKNLLLLIFINLFIIVYIFLSLIYLFNSFGFSEISNDFAEMGENIPNINLILLTAMIVNVIEIVALTIFAISKLRSWVIFFLHGVVVVVSVVSYRYTAFLDSLFLSNENIGMGIMLSLFSYPFFAIGTWFLIRFRNIIVPLITYTVIFTVVLLLSFIISDAYISNDINALLKRIDILFVLIIFFLLISALMYFENLLRFTRSMKKASQMSHRNITSFLVAMFMVIIPALLAILITLSRIEPGNFNIDLSWLNFGSNAQPQELGPLNVSLPNLGDFLKVLGFLLLLILLFYLFIYPFLRYLKIKKAVSHSDPYARITNIYTIIVDLSTHLDANIKSSNTPQENIETIQKDLEIDLSGLDWIYNRAVLREKLLDEDLKKVSGIWEEFWKSVFGKRISFKSLTYFYRLKRI